MGEWGNLGTAASAYTANPLPAVIGFGIDILSGASARSKQRKQAKKIAGIIDEELAKFPEAISAVEDIYGARTDITGAQKEREMERLTTESGQNIYDFMESYRAASGQSGFAGSGALERGREQYLGRAQQKYTYGIETIYDLFAEKDIENLIERERRLSEIEAQRTNLRIQRAGLDVPGLPPRDSIIGQSLPAEMYEFYGD